ncbi:hypothetical protein Syun_007060 [Stephania yunnanensis]|uniref:Uncharacterized protein n=1 Tax=Stephania yunnanensis TaxID=152371 RepID=A0AAP0PZY7_9MAGN
MARQADAFIALPVSVANPSLLRYSDETYVISDGISPCIYIRPLELDNAYVIEGVNVVLLEANHCPGATLILFHLADGRCYLHTGDFRASKMMRSHPLLAK